MMEEIDDVNRVLRKTPRASTPGDCCTHTVARSMPDSPSGFSQGARFIITRSSNSPPTRASVCQSGRLPSGHPASPPVARTDGRVPLTQGRTPPPRAKVIEAVATNSGFRCSSDQGPRRTFAAADCAQSAILLRSHRRRRRVAATIAAIGGGDCITPPTGSSSGGAR